MTLTYYNAENLKKFKKVYGFEFEETIDPIIKEFFDTGIINIPIFAKKAGINIKSEDEFWKEVHKKYGAEGVECLNSIIKTGAELSEKIISQIEYLQQKN